MQFKSIVISSLLLIGTASCANVSPPVAKAEADCTPKETALDSTQEVSKKRAIGKAVADRLNATTGNAEDDLALKKRIEELESLVEQQKKLIELYKDK